MSDSHLRQVERDYQVSPQDVPTATRLDEACLRAGRPSPPRRSAQARFLAALRHRALHDAHPAHLAVRLRHPPPTSFVRAVQLNGHRLEGVEEWPPSESPAPEDVIRRPRGAYVRGHYSMRDGVLVIRPRRGERCMPGSLLLVLIDHGEALDLLRYRMDEGLGEEPWRWNLFGMTALHPDHAELVERWGAGALSFVGR